MLKAMLAVLILLFSVIFTLDLFAAERIEENDKQKVVKSKTVSVVATRSGDIDALTYPGMINSIQTKTATVSSSATLNDLLKDMPNVDVMGGPRRNAMQPMIRGYSGDGIVVLMDGARQNFAPNHNGRIYIDPSVVQSVDVLSGASSAVYGGGALGGVMSFKTKDAYDFLNASDKYRNRNFGVYTSYGYGSGNNEKYASAHFFGVSKDKKLDYLFANTARTSGDIRLGGGSKLRNVDDNVFNQLLKVNYKLNDVHSFNLAYSLYSNGGNELNNPQLDKESASQTQADSVALTKKSLTSGYVGLKHSYTPDSRWLNVKTNVYLSDSEVNYRYLETSAAGDERNIRLTTIGADVVNRSKLVDNDVRQTFLNVGIDHYTNIQNTSAKTSGTIADWGVTPDGQDSLTGLFAQLQDSVKTQIGEFASFASSRFDYFTSGAKNFNSSYRDDSKLTFKLGSTYKPKEWGFVFANYAQGFRAPSVTEKYANGQHFRVTSSLANNFVSNPNLRPETNQTVEGGFGLDFSDILVKNDDFNFKSTYYYTWADNYIFQEVTVPNLGSPACPYPFSSGTCSGGTTTYTNIAKATIRGAEIVSNYKIKDVKLTASYSYTDGRDTTTGDKLSSLQPQIFKFIGNYSVDKHLSVGARYWLASSKTYLNKNSSTLSESKVGGYSTYDIYMEMMMPKRDDLKVNIALENITDKRYSRIAAGAYEMGRNVRVGISYLW